MEELWPTLESRAGTSQHLGGAREGARGRDDGTREVLHPQKSRAPRSPAVVHSWQAPAAGRAPVVPRVARGLPFPYASGKPGCPAPAGCVPISLHRAFAFGVLLCPAGMWPRGGPRPQGVPIPRGSPSREINGSCACREGEQELTPGITSESAQGGWEGGKPPGSPGAARGGRTAVPGPPLPLLCPRSWGCWDPPALPRLVPGSG